MREPLAARRLDMIDVMRKAWPEVGYFVKQFRMIGVTPDSRTGGKLPPVRYAVLMKRAIRPSR